MNDDLYYLIASFVLFIFQIIDNTDHNHKIDRKHPGENMDEYHAHSGASIFAVIVLSVVLIGKLIRSLIGG